MAYTDIYTAATNDAHVLRQQVAVAIVKAAVDVINEATNTEDHSQRMAWARRALSDPTGWAAKSIWKVLENATIQSAPTEATDSDVQFVINSLVNTLSKAT